MDFGVYNKKKFNVSQHYLSEVLLEVEYHMPILCSAITSEACYKLWKSHRPSHTNHLLFLPLK